MSFNHINTTNKKEKTDICRSEKSYSAYGHKAGDFSEILKEARRATNDPNQEREFVKKTESDSEQESEWEQKQLKISGPTEAEKRQVAAEQAAKRRRLAKYMMFLEETSIKRAEEEMEMIAKRSKRTSGIPVTEPSRRISLFPMRAALRISAKFSHNITVLSS